MRDSIDISVIITSYNCELFIGQCIESVLNQQMNSIEIVLVDDNSTDGSVSIINQYLENNKNITFIQNENNRGVSASRNCGLAKAKGDYIYFLDSDDFFEEDVLPLMINKIKNDDGEVLLVDAYKYFDNSKKIYYKNVFRGDAHVHFKGHAAWWLLIQRKLLIENQDIRFPNRVHPGEDTLFTFILFSHAKKISRLCIPALNYRQHDNSKMNTFKLDSHEKDLNLLSCIRLLDKFFLNEKSLIHRKKAYLELRRSFLLSMSNNIQFLLNENIFWEKFFYGILKFLFTAKITNNDRLLVKICRIPIWNYKIRIESCV